VHSAEETCKTVGCRGQSRLPWAFFFPCRVALRVCKCRHKCIQNRQPKVEISPVEIINNTLWFIQMYHTQTTTKIMPRTLFSWKCIFLHEKYATQDHEFLAKLNFACSFMCKMFTDTWKTLVESMYFFNFYTVTTYSYFPVAHLKDI